MSDWQTFIDRAVAKGYSVQFNEEWEGWTVITPKRPRRPPEEHGTYKDQRAAWRGAAGMANDHD